MRTIPSLVLFVLGSTGLFAGPVTYTLIEDLPAQFSGDDPTATWTYVWTDPGYLNRAQEFPTPPVLNAAAITDGYTFVGGDAEMHADSSGDMVVIDIEHGDVEFEIGSTTYSGANDDSCGSPQNPTSCMLSGPMYYEVDGNPEDLVPGWGTDALDISSAPEPRSFAMAGLGLLALAFFSRRRRTS